MCKYCLESNTKLLLKIETPWQSPNRKYAEIWSIQFCFGFTVGLSRNNDIKDIAAIAFLSWLSLIYHVKCERPCCILISLREIIDNLKIHVHNLLDQFFEFVLSQTFLKSTTSGDEQKIIDCIDIKLWNTIFQ